MNVHGDDSATDQSFDYYLDSKQKKSRFKVEFDFERAAILTVVLLLLLFIPVWLICFISRPASRLHWTSYDYFHRQQESLKKRFEATHKSPANVHGENDEDHDRGYMTKLQQQTNKSKQSVRTDTFVVSENGNENESTIEKVDSFTKDVNTKSRFGKKNVSIKRKNVNTNVQKKTMSTGKKIADYNLKSELEKSAEEFSSLE